MTDPLQRVDVAPGIKAFAVRSPTLPPATHTNVWVLGDTVVDPACPDPTQQDQLYEALTADGTVGRIFLTHHHQDHFQGALDLARRTGAPILAHPLTAERLPFQPETAPDRLPGDLQVLHTPGHAPGHLALWHEPSRTVVAGDLVAGVGTILIEPEDDGHLATYLHSLEQIRALGPHRLLPAHGPVLNDPEAVLAHYISHRHARSTQILAALADQVLTPAQLAPLVYPELPTNWHPIAAIQIHAHLIWLAEHQQVQLGPSGWRI